MRVIGIDEAGRGPVLGPLVLCGVRANAQQREQLRAIGVADSKRFTGSNAAAQRRKLAEQITVITEVELALIDSATIDHWVLHGQGLNALERSYATAILERLGEAERIVADGKTLFSPLATRFPQLEALDRAESADVCVAAASICAKHARDTALAQLLAPYHQRFGEIRGGGYPNAATARFLRGCQEQLGALPDGLRRSWGWSELQVLLAREAEPG
ncbi:MAG: hypothetical protein H6707_21210 [Deltaproteobacteria bacterium]|nr:hypothetical protein [Deltaproteobacteria bacterium]